MPRAVVLGRIANVLLPAKFPPKFTSLAVNDTAPRPEAVLAKAMVAVPAFMVSALAAPVTAPPIVKLAFAAAEEIEVAAPKVTPVLLSPISATPPMVSVP